MFEARNLSFSYRVGDREVHVLKGLNFKVNEGEFVTIQGPSGSGKSTLFYILGFLLKPSSGNVIFDGVEIQNLTNDQLTFIRNQRIGFIFQQFHLLAKTTTLENILLPTRYPSEIAVAEVSHREKALSLAKKLGLGNHLSHLPNQLSGGQQQRVAIARALMNDIELILADEPTGNLDSQNAQQILSLLNELNRQGKTIILITHDPEVAKQCGRVLNLKDGMFTNQVDVSPVDTSANTLKKKEVSLSSMQSWSSYRNIFRSVVPLVGENLIRNKTKSILTMLGVVIGVAAVLAMVTLGQFTKRKILETYEKVGVNKLMIRGHRNWNLKATDFIPTNFVAFDWKKDFIPLRRIFSEIKYMSPILTSGQNSATSGGLIVSDKVAMIGVNAEYLTISNQLIRIGRNITPFDIENRNPVCIIGHEIDHKVFSRTQSIGQILTISDGRKTTFPCRVIGVMASVTSNKEWLTPNLEVVLPYTYFQTIVSDWWNTQIYEVAIQLYSGADVEMTGKKIKLYFNQKYGKSGEFEIDSDSTLVAQMKRFLNLFAVLLTVIAILSLVVGGIGINNMMLVSVTERLKEFGIRKALGATDRSIRIQVLMESVILCFIAGLIGVGLGFGAYELMIFGATQFVPGLVFEWIYDPVAIFLSLLSIIAVGIASGLIPALRAERLQVIEALRAE